MNQGLFYNQCVNIEPFRMNLVNPFSNLKLNRLWALPKQSPQCWAWDPIGVQETANEYRSESE